MDVSTKFPIKLGRSAFLAKSAHSIYLILWTLFKNLLSCVLFMNVPEVVAEAVRTILIVANGSPTL